MKRAIGVMAVLSLLTAVGAVVGTGTAQAASSCTSYTTFWENAGGSIGWVWQDLPTVGSQTGNANCTLGVGNQSTAVRTLQHALNVCNSYETRLVLSEDGAYGTHTQTAVRNLQTFWGIPHDGVYGPQTRRYMSWPTLNADGLVGCWDNFYDNPLP